MDVALGLGLKATGSTTKLFLSKFPVEAKMASVQKAFVRSFCAFLLGNKRL